MPRRSTITAAIINVLRAATSRSAILLSELCTNVIIRRLSKTGAEETGTSNQRKGARIMKKTKTEDDMFFEAVKRSRPRELMPSPKIFKDRTKYDRNRAKEEERKAIAEEEV